MNQVHNDRKVKQCDQTTDVCIKIVLSYHWQFSLFSDSQYKNASDHEVSGFGYDSRNPPLLWIIWIRNPFLDFNKEMKCPFSDHKSGLDFSKEMHPKFREA